jgi:hypothetical protein
MWEPGVKLMLPLATEGMLVERGWDNVAILDPAGLVSCETAVLAPMSNMRLRINDPDGVQEEPK